jgi:hypothetical protein
MTGNVNDSNMTSTGIADSDITDSMYGSDMVREQILPAPPTTRPAPGTRTLPAAATVPPASGSMLPTHDATRRPTHHVDKNRVPYPSALAMLKEGTTVLNEDIAAHNYPPQIHLHKYCALFIRADSMTKYKKIQTEVYARKDHIDRGDEEEWDKRVNDQIEEHVQELVAMAAMALEFLNRYVAKLINKEVEAGLQQCLQVLESKILEVIRMEKTWKTWERNWSVADKIPEAIYDFNWVCVSVHTSALVYGDAGDDV